MELDVGGHGIINVDVDLASIIELLWGIGIRASSCCQESAPGVASIEPMTLADMERLYDVLTALDLREDTSPPAGDSDGGAHPGTGDGSHGVAAHEPLYYCRQTSNVHPTATWTLVRPRAAPGDVESA